MGILNAVSKVANGGSSPSSTAKSSNSGRTLELADYTLLEYSSVTLSGSGTAQQNRVVVGNPVGLDMQKIRMHFKTTLTSSANQTSTAIENLVYGLQVFDKSGNRIMAPNGSYLQISDASRNISNYGYDDPSPTIAMTTSGVAGTWDTEIPLPIAQDLFPISIIVIFNNYATAGTDATAGTVNDFKLTGDFKGTGAKHLALVSKLIPEASTGTIHFGTNYDQGHVVYNQWIRFDADANLNATGTFTFTPDGANYEFNTADAQRWINLEDRRFIAKGVNGTIGHVAGLLNMFTEPFLVTPNTDLAINFASAPAVNGNASNLQLQMIESL